MAAGSGVLGWKPFVVFMVVVLGLVVGGKRLVRGFSRC